MAWWALRTADGPATLRLAPAHEGWRVMAWGLGAERAADRVPRLLGCRGRPGRAAAAARVPCGTWSAACRACASGGATRSWPRSCRPSSSRRSPGLKRSVPTGDSCCATASRHRARAGCTCRRLLPVLAELPYYELHPLGPRAAPGGDAHPRRTRGRAARGGSRTCHRRRRWLSCGRSPGWAPGPRPRRPGRPSAIRTPSAWATSTCPISSAGRWPGSRAGMTRACWSCWSRTGASAHGWCASWSSPASSPPRYGPRMRTRSIERL